MCRGRFEARACAGSRQRAFNSLKRTHCAFAVPQDGKFKTMEGVYAFHVAERKAGTDGVAKAKGQPQDKH